MYSTLYVEKKFAQPWISNYTHHNHFVKNFFFRKTSNCCKTVKSQEGWATSMYDITIRDYFLRCNGTYVQNKFLKNYKLDTYLKLCFRLWTKMALYTLIWTWKTRRLRRRKHSSSMEQTTGLSTLTSISLGEPILPVTQTMKNPRMKRGKKKHENLIFQIVMHPLNNENFFFKVGKYKKWK